jgi:RND superfamily putative drug exporter
VAELKKLPQVVGVTDPFQTGTVSKDGRIAYAIVAYPVPVANVTSDAQSALLASGGPAKTAGIAVNFGGQVAQAQTKTDTELVGILIAFLVLLFGFGSVIAGLLPLISAIAGVAVTNLALLALTSVINESSTTAVLATMIGLAVGIDYSLFVLNRAPPAVGGGDGSGPVRRKGGGDFGIGRVLCRNHRAHCSGRPQHRQHPLPDGHGTAGGGRGRGCGSGGHHIGPRHAGLCRRAARQ